MIVGDGGPLRVQLLGPVRAWQGDQERALGAPRQRAVLGMLARRANQTVSRGELVDGVWGQAPPASAVNGVHIYVAGLRRAFEPDRAHRAPGRVLLSSRSGYLLQLEPGQLDAEAFDVNLARARGSRAAGDLVAAARSLDAALRLWQAAPLSGIPGPWAEIERVRLGELRLTAIEERNEVMLAQGRHDEAAAQLAGLVREHPLRERLRAQLLLALYRCGRQADALAMYADTRRVLIEELGIEPGPELRRLQKQILVADAALELLPAPAAITGAGPPRPARAPRPAPTPRELPADVDSFTGRAGELAKLDDLLATAGGQRGRSGQTCARPSAVVISAVSGTAGVGKTALAVHWAHRVRKAFPDGQLYADLRGYDPGQPVRAEDVRRGSCARSAWPGRTSRP